LFLFLAGRRPADAGLLGVLGASMSGPGFSQRARAFGRAASKP